MLMRNGSRLPASGFTVIEMMITLVVAAILIMVVVPGFNDMIANNRIRSEVYAMRAMLMEARSEAMTERRNVSFCASKDGKTCSGSWNEGYIAFFDNSDTGDLGKVDADDVIVLSRATDTSTVTIKYSNANNVLFNSRGNAQSVPKGKNYNGTFKFCDKRGAKEAAGLIVSRVGTVTAAVDSNNPVDDIVNDAGGANIVCP